MPPTIKFGTDGWRAVIAREFTFDNFAVVVQAVANLLRSGRLPGQPQDRHEILIGYDARAMAREFALEGVAILEGNRIPTALVSRPTPTPAVVHAIVDREALGALVLTASHNAPSYLGVKFVPWYASPANTDITTEIEAEVAKVYVDRDIKHAAFTSAAYLDPRPAYLAAIRRCIDLDAVRDAGLRICVDPMHGTTMGYIDTLLKSAGCDVQMIRGDSNPTFGGALPDPKEERLGPLSERVMGESLDLGLANDGDGDRFGIIDQGGRYMTACEFVSLAVDYHVMERRPPTGPIRFARTLPTTHLVDAIALKHGAAVVETPVGFKYIGEAMRNGALLGGEESGGLARSDHLPEKDGVFACLLAAEMVAKRGMPLWLQLDQLIEEHGDYQWFNRNLHIRPETRDAVMARLQALTSATTLARRKVTGVDTRDGVKVLLEDGSWLLGRPSGTEPIIRMYAEARSEDARIELERAMTALVGEEE